MELSPCIKDARPAVSLVTGGRAVMLLLLLLPK